jgi:hypothetical protein
MRAQQLIAIGYAPALAAAFADDPDFVNLALATHSGAKWGDIMYDYERNHARARVAELTTLINDKTNTGRWRLDIERRALVDQFNL